MTADPSLLTQLEAAPWRWATTYAATAPHWYVTRHAHPELVACVRDAITQHGYTASWGGRRYRYVDLGGFKYWYVPPVLNREPLEAKTACIEVDPSS